MTIIHETGFDIVTLPPKTGSIKKLVQGVKTHHQIKEGEQRAVCWAAKQKDTRFLRYLLDRRCYPWSMHEKVSAIWGAGLEDCWANVDILIRTYKKRGTQPNQSFPQLHAAEQISKYLAALAVTKNDVEALRRLIKHESSLEFLLPGMGLRACGLIQDPSSALQDPGRAQIALSLLAPACHPHRHRGALTILPQAGLRNLLNIIRKVNGPYCISQLTTAIPMWQRSS
jgi:hypothetical protein